MFSPDLVLETPKVFISVGTVCCCRSECVTNAVDILRPLLLCYTSVIVCLVTVWALGCHAVVADRCAAVYEGRHLQGACGDGSGSRICLPYLDFHRGVTGKLLLSFSISLRI